MIVADAAKVTAAAWFLSVVIVSARPLLFGDAFTLSFDRGFFFLVFLLQILISMIG